MVSVTNEMEVSSMVQNLKSDSQNSEKKTMINLGIVSVILSWISCVFPPTQLLFGAAASLFAYISKKDRKFTGVELTVFVAGIISIGVSVILFGLVMFSMDIMKDPQYASLVEESLQQYEALFDAMGIEQ